MSYNYTTKHTLAQEPIVEKSASLVNIGHAPGVCVYVEGLNQLNSLKIK